MSLCSCFEVYLRGILSLSMESRPGIIFDDKDAFDGTRLLKYNEKIMQYNNTTYPFYKNIDKIIIGEWNNRILGYKDAFKTVPDILNNNIGELEKLRKLRNNIAHFFRT